MADESVQDKNQAQAQEKTSLPEGVTVGSPIGNERSEYFKMVEKSKDKIKRYGETDFTAFMNKVGSDGSFAQKVVEDLLKGDDSDVQFGGVLPDSPQEHNVTGKLDHTTAVAKKLSGTGAENIAPTAGVNKDTAPEPEGKSEEISSFASEPENK